MNFLSTDPDNLISISYLEVFLGVNLEKQVETADKETKAAFDNFRNQFVQQNCHRDVEIRWILKMLKQLLFKNPCKKYDEYNETILS